MNSEDNKDEATVTSWYQALPKTQPSEPLDSMVLARAKKQITPHKSPIDKVRYWSVAASFLVVSFTTFMVVKQPDNLVSVPPSNLTPELFQADSERAAPSTVLQEPMVARTEIGSQNTELLARSRVSQKQVGNHKELVVLANQYNALNTISPKTDKHFAKQAELQSELFSALMKLRASDPGYIIEPKYLNLLTEQQVKRLEASSQHQE